METLLFRRASSDPVLIKSRFPTMRRPFFGWTYKKDYGILGLYWGVPIPIIEKCCSAASCKNFMPGI